MKNIKESSYKTTDRDIDIEQLVKMAKRWGYIADGKSGNVTDSMFDILTTIIALIIECDIFTAVISLIIE